MDRNAVRDTKGRVIGYRCVRCEGIFDKMWGSICNQCREHKHRLNLAEARIEELETIIRKREKLF